MTTFPALIPKTREVGAGDFPKTEFTARSGQVHRRQHAASPKRVPLKLSFRNVPDSWADEVFAHYRGNMSVPFDLDATTMQAGLDAAVKDVLLPVVTHEWFYDGHPLYESVRPGFCTVTVNLMGFPTGVLELPNCAWVPALTAPPADDPDWQLTTSLTTTEQYEAGLVILTDAGGSVDAGRMLLEDDQTTGWGTSWEARCRFRLVGGANGGGFAISVANKTEGDRQPTYSNIATMADASASTVAAVFRPSTNSVHLFGPSGELDSAPITGFALTNNSAWVYAWIGYSGDALHCGISASPLDSNHNYATSPPSGSVQVNHSFNFNYEIGGPSAVGIHATRPSGGPSHHVACFEWWSGTGGGGG